jgi:hypothetical protein
VRSVLIFPVNGFVIMATKDLSFPDSFDGARSFGCQTINESTKWGGRRDSNPRRPESQSGALPAELRPPSSTSDTRGAPGRNRTCNRRLRRPVLYPVELRAPYKSITNSAKRNLSGRWSGPRQTESEVRADYIAVSQHLKRQNSRHHRGQRENLAGELYELRPRAL